MLQCLLIRKFLVYNCVKATLIKVLKVFFEKDIYVHTLYCVCELVINIQEINYSIPPLKNIILTSIYHVNPYHISYIKYCWKNNFKTDKGNHLSHVSHLYWTILSQYMCHCVEKIKMFHIR